MEKKTKEMIVGGVAGAVTDTVIDFPIAQLFGGKMPSIQIYDANGYFFGVGAGDAVTATSGLALYLYGRKRNQQVENVGKGWLLAWGLLKGAELISAIYDRLKIMFPFQDWNLLVVPLSNRVNNQILLAGTPGTGAKGTGEIRPPTIEETKYATSDLLLV